MSAIAVDIQPWEVHSELVLVCPDVWRRAVELLPERDPDAFLTRQRQPFVVPVDSVETDELDAGLPTAVCAYTLRRVVQTGRSALAFVTGLVALASLAELLH